MRGRVERIAPNDVFANGYGVVQPAEIEREYRRIRQHRRV